MDISEIERKIKEFKAKGLEWNVGYSEWRGEWGRIIYYIEEQVKLPSGEWISKYKIREYFEKNKLEFGNTKQIEYLLALEFFDLVEFFPSNYPAGLSAEYVDLLS